MNEPELLPWPDDGCLECFFFEKDKIKRCSRTLEQESKYDCMLLDSDMYFIWLTKEEWLKRRIKE